MSSKFYVLEEIQSHCCPSFGNKNSNGVYLVPTNAETSTKMRLRELGLGLKWRVQGSDLNPQNCQNQKTNDNNKKQH